MSWHEKRKKEVDKLLEQITHKLSVTKEAMSSKSRKTVLVLARRYFMNILFEVFNVSDGMTHGDISRIIKRDRTSFIHNRKEHQNHYSRYKTYKLDYEALKKEFISSIS